MGPAGYKWYEPTEVIAGAHDGFLRGRCARSSAPSWKRALAEARDYAKHNRSESLLVWHRGARCNRRITGWVSGRPTWSIPAACTRWPADCSSPPRHCRRAHRIAGRFAVAKYIPRWRGTDKEPMTSPQRAAHVERAALVRHPRRARYRTQLAALSQPVLGRGPARGDPHVVHAGIGNTTTATSPPTSCRTSSRGATGRRYAEYFSEALLKPLGAPGGFIWVNREGGMPHGGCCLMLPPETWLRFGLLVMNGGSWDGQQLLPDYWMTEMLTPSPNNEHFGLMIWLGRPHAERPALSPPGLMAQRRAQARASTTRSRSWRTICSCSTVPRGRSVAIVPSEQLVIVRTGFRPLPRPAGVWDNAFLPNTIIPRDQTRRERHSPMTRRIIAAVVLLIAAAVVIDWTFWSRFITIRDQTAVSLPGWISPTATVEGGFREELASVNPIDRVLSAGAIAELTDYAEKVESYSLIVHHGDGIQFEKYWGEFGPDDVTETYSMAKSGAGPDVRLRGGRRIHRVHRRSGDPICFRVGGHGQGRHDNSPRAADGERPGTFPASISVTCKTPITRAYGCLSVRTWRTPCSGSISPRRRERNSTTTVPTASCSC